MNPGGKKYKIIEEGIIFLKILSSCVHFEFLAPVCFAQRHLTVLIITCFEVWEAPRSVG